jgi:dienelactone hydrolase
MVYFWYPASGRPGETHGVYYPGAAQMERVPEVQARMHRAFDAAWPGILSGEIFSHAAERAPAAAAPARFPVVVFSHGLGSTGFNYTCLIEDLVSRGYIVAAIEHTYSAKAVWFPDGRVVPLEEGAQRSRGNGAAQGINEGAADVRFVLDRLTALDGNARDFLLAGRVDVKAAAAMGHSLGAEFAARACQLDDRFRACVDMDGGMVPVAALPISDDGATIRQPLLFLEAYHPESQMGGLSHETIAGYYKTKEEQLRNCPRGTYDVVLRAEGIEHPSFSDLPVLFAGHDEYPDRAVALHNLDLIESFIRAFLDKNLKQQRAPLLDGGASVPEATVTAYGR